MLPIFFYVGRYLNKYIGILSLYLAFFREQPLASMGYVKLSSQNKPLSCASRSDWTVRVSIKAEWRQLTKINGQASQKSALRFP